MSANVWPKYVDQLAGRWKCTKFEQYSVNGTEKTFLRLPHGDSPLGSVVLTRGGFLSSHVADPATMHAWNSGQAWITADDADVAHVARRISMYCGQVELFEDTEGLYWRTSVEIASDPTFMREKQERRVFLFQEGGRQCMRLTPVNVIKMIDDNPTSQIELTWEKLE